MTYKRRVIVLFTFLMGIALLGACSGGGTSEASDDPNVVAEGLYQRACIGCHGGNLQGASAPGLLNTGLTRQEFIDATYLGVGSMPGGLVSEEVAELITDWIFKIEAEQ
ncbi:mono/diheme cytochrome c family protein [Evansella vedderi]|uniref:Mono/diheme cytochrome c family protein n=1 Tax=Evansella vedderi TaxID=38282 RepID=A0ABT9ZP11_9BACI|nr:cytochrome c [Evansella vedderi]MDQ0252973.1 mono/diheme cytochrome c family protein [Evansella vedderi]